MSISQDYPVFFMHLIDNVIRDDHDERSLKETKSRSRITTSQGASANGIGVHTTLQTPDEYSGDIAEIYTAEHELGNIHT